MGVLRILLIVAMLGGLAAAAEAPGEPPAAPAAPAHPRSYGYVYSSSDEHVSYLGIDPQDVTRDRMAELKLKEERGVEVAMVDQDAPAAKAGLKEHDVILQFNGQPVEGVEELKRMIRETPPGRTVTLGISRDGQMMSLPVTLEDRSKSGEYKGWVMPPMPPIPPVPEIDIDIPEIHISPYTSRSGLRIETLTPQLGEYFGVKDGSGVLVSSVEHGSAAEAAGFKAGDVILKVGDERISNSSDYKMALRRYRSGKVPVSVMRDHREQQLTIDIPSRGAPQSKLYGPDFQKSMSEMRHNLEQMRMNDQQIQEEIAKAMSAARKQLQQSLSHAQKAYGDWN
jgi:membrane-associated protease RseP (regulator of RpoE activity)